MLIFGDDRLDNIFQNFYRIFFHNLPKRKQPLTFIFSPKRTNLKNTSIFFIPLFHHRQYPISPRFQQSQIPFSHLFKIFTERTLSSSSIISIIVPTSEIDVLDIIEDCLFESGRFIIFYVFAGAEFSEILASLGQVVVPKLHFDPAQLISASLDIEKYNSFATIHHLQQLLNYTNMQFVLNPNPLPISTACHKKPQGLQYYEWKYKQKLSLEEQKQKQLQKYLLEIEKEQQEQRKSDINNNKKRMHHEGTFYEYNMQWKKRVDGKVDEEKAVKEREIQKEEEKMRKKVYERQDKKEISFGYKGPIEGWDEHFENYLKKKTYNESSQPSQLTFQPKINDRSRKMTQGMIGKVEDRLLMFGQYTKMRNQQQINKINNQSLSEHYPNQRYFTGGSAQSDIFYRLYKQGEENNRRKREGAMEEGLTFQPKINKLPEQIEDRIMKRRKPLYYIKNSISHSSSQFNKSLNNGQPQKKITKGDFEAFLKRNEALLQMKKKIMLTMREHIEQKQNLQKSQCTFSPILNPNSKRIQKSLKQNNKKFQQKLHSQITTSLLHMEPQNQLQNIDISKLTVLEFKQTSRCDDSDSLSIYRIEGSQKERSSMKSFRKEQEYETYITNQKMKSERNSKEMLIKAEELEHQEEEVEQEEMGEIAEDSIDGLKKSEWEDQLESIESCIQNMMIRAIK